MAKGEISWKREDPDGEKWQVYAHRESGSWVFFQRQRRYENWEKVESPILSDWLELLNGIDRRVNRRVCKPEDSTNVRRTILKFFPGTELPPPTR